MELGVFYCAAVCFGAQDVLHEETDDHDDSRTCQPFVQGLYFSSDKTHDRQNQGLEANDIINHREAETTRDFSGVAWQLRNLFLRVVKRCEVFHASSALC